MLVARNSSSGGAGGASGTTGSKPACNLRGSCLLTTDLMPQTFRTLYGTTRAFASALLLLGAAACASEPPPDVGGSGHTRLEIYCARPLPIGSRLEPPVVTCGAWGAQFPMGCKFDEKFDDGKDGTDWGCECFQNRESLPRLIEGPDGGALSVPPRSPPEGVWLCAPSGVRGPSACAGGVSEPGGKLEVICEASH